MTQQPLAMNKCSNADHPHCTLWVMPGDVLCAAGHAQAQPAGVPAIQTEAEAAPATSFDLVTAARAGRILAATAPSASPGDSAMPAPTRLPSQFPQILPASASVMQRPHLHISGFDPRAAGGRQAIKLDLRGMAPSASAGVSMRLRSALIAGGGSTHQFERTTRGDWRPVFVEFSSRGMEHGQYQIDVELDSIDSAADPAAPTLRRWVCTMLLLVPRADASLTDIHHTFLATHKNVRVLADDASIARVNGVTGGGRVDIDVTARNASIAHLDLAAVGKVDLGFSSIAWDEDLIEIDVPAQALPHPFPSSAACLVNAAPDHGAQRQVRLFGLDECVLGRWEQYDPHSDVLLAHFTDSGLDQGGLTRRLSGRHAIIRRGERGFEIEDVSRYGILLDGVWPGKHHPVPLRLGMKIEMTASIKGVVVLNVSAILPHGVILHRLDQGEAAECLYVVAPDRHPGFPLPACEREPRAAVMPVLFHRDGGFWHLDTVTGVETALTPSLALDRLSPFQRHVRFAAEAYPESWIIRTAAGTLQPAAPVDLQAV